MLKYVKVNENEIEFKNGLNIITCIPRQGKDKTNNNIGKTTLIHILQVIYGQKKFFPISSSLAKKIKKKGYKCAIEWLFEFEGEQHFFSYDIDKEKIIFYNRKDEITLNEYKNKISNLLGNKVKIFRDTMVTDYRFIRKTSDSFFLAETFSHRNKSYVAFFLLKILFSRNIENEDLAKIEKYFEKIAKRNSYSNIKGKYHNELIEELMEVNEKDKFIELDMLAKEKKHYKHLKENKIDGNIILELKSLKLEINFDEVINFHKSLILDYNNIIDDKLTQIDKRMNSIKEDIPEATLANYSQSDIDIAIEVSEFLKNVDKELTVDYNNIKNILEKILKNVNNELRKYNELINDFLEGDIKSANEFTEGRILNEALHSLQFSLKLNNTSGDANKYINALLLYAYILRDGNINIVALDTHHTSEVSNLGRVLKEINKITKNKQYIVLLFDDNINEEEFVKEIVHKIGTDKETLLGYSV